MRNRKKNNIKNIKDYIVPLITFVLIFILIYVAFSGGDSSGETNLSNNESVQESNAISLQVGSTDTQGLVMDSQNKKTVLKSGTNFLPGDTLKVQEGDVSFTIDGSTTYALDKNGELQYGQNGKMSLVSSALWVNTQDDVEIDMKFATIKAGVNSALNLEQNEVSSTIYLLGGTAEIINNGGVSTLLSPGNKIKISNKDASKDDVDLSLLKEKFDDYFKISDWYLKNNTHSTYNSNEGENSDELSLSGTLEDTGTGALNKKPTTFFSSALLSFDTIYDEGSVTATTTNISGKFVEDSVAKIIIQGKNAVINTENKTFNVIGVDTSKKVNDIIIKVLDEGNNVIGKYVYTLYYTEGTSTTNNTEGFAKINTSSYPVNDSDFLISIPTVKDGVSFSDENTFYGTVKNPDVASVLINGYKLKTYNGSTFRYHAYTRFKTLGEGVNNYEIKYLGKDGEVILKKYVTINKKNNSPAVQDKKIISGETKIEE